MKLRVLFVAWALLLGALPPTFAQRPAQPEEEPSLSERASEELGKLKELFEQKKYQEILARVEAVIPQLANPSYDRALFHQVQAQIFAELGNERAMVRPLELAIAQGKLPLKTAQDFRFYLSQLYLNQENSPRSLQWLEEWFSHGGKPTLDQTIFHASLLYSLHRYKESLEVARRSLAMTPRPSDNQYILVLANYQSLNDNRSAAETLELMVRAKPESQQLWGQLLQTYLAEGDDVRAIVTLERAMERGFFQSQRDYFTLVGLYYNLEQHRATIDLIEKGFASGKLPPEQQNWELLAACWQIIGDYSKAVEALGRAARVVASGDVDFTRAQLFYASGDEAAALANTRRAYEKGKLKRPSVVAQQWGDLAAILRNIPELEAALVAMRKYPELQKKVIDHENSLREFKEEEARTAEAARNASAKS